MTKKLLENSIVEGPLFGSFAKFLLPLLMGSLIQQSYSTIDALIVGNYAGKIALAAMDSPFAYIRLLINAFIMLSSGGGIVISMLYGAGERKSVEKAVQLMMLFSIAGGIVITIVGIVLTPLGLDLMNVPDEIYPLSEVYLKTYFTGTLFVFIYNMASGILRAVGDSRTPFIYLIISGVTNILLDFLFVKYIPWGVFGAAFATVLAQALAAVLIFIRLVKVEDCFGLRLCKLDGNIRLLSRSLALGAPMAMQTVMFSVANMYIQSGLNTFGTDVIAGWTIVGRVDIMVYIIAEALGLTVTTFVAQNMGAGKKDRMVGCIHVALIICAVLYVIMSSILYFFIGDLARLFTKDAGAIAQAVEFERLIAPYYFLYALAEIYAGTTKGIGNTVGPMIATILGIGVYRVLWMAFVFPLFNTTSAIMISYPISWGLMMLFCIIIFIVIGKKHYEYDPLDAENPIS